MVIGSRLIVGRFHRATGWRQQRRGQGMNISCGLPPGRAVVEHAQLAESLGYDRVWLYDSSAILLDGWVSLARVAEHTDRIGLGTAVVVPSLRSVVATAAAIARL